MSCELCDTIDWKEDETYRIVTCKTCNVEMLVLREHRNFTEFEKELIELVHCHRYFSRYSSIRWEQRRIKDHAHCHFE